MSNFWLNRKAIARVIKSGISIKDWQRGVSIWRLGPLAGDDNGKFNVFIDDGNNNYREWTCDTAKEAATKFLQIQ
jgi:hypothetical protein